MDDRYERELLHNAIAFAKQAGQLVVRQMKAPGGIAQKKNHSDLVTETDKRSEQLLRTLIGEQYPEHWILSEEDNGEKNSYEAFANKGGGYGWIIDPVDGTTNFIHNLGYFAVSIGVVREGEPVIGVVFNPVTKELFHARVGHGAYVNDVPIRVSDESALENALLATGFQATDWRAGSRVLRQADCIAGSSRNLRIFGAASLDLCLVATGRLTGFWHEGLHPWDAAAGVLIVKEAGGEVTEHTGKPYQLVDNSLFASNGNIHEDFLSVVQSVR